MCKIVVLALASVLGTGAYGKHDLSPSPPPALPICNVLAKAAEYDGKEITVRLIYYSTPEGGIGSGSECPHQNVGLRNAPDFKEDQRIRKAWRKIGAYKSVYLVVRGKFSVCRESNCFVGTYWAPYRIEVRQDLSVQPVRAEPK